MWTAPEVGHSSNLETTESPHWSVVSTITSRDSSGTIQSSTNVKGTLHASTFISCIKLFLLCCFDFGL